MSGRSANKRHPDYPAYIEKCKLLWNLYKEKIEAEESKYGDYMGKDSPASEVVRELDRKRNEELKLLQKKYEQIFTEK